MEYNGDWVKIVQNGTGPKFKELDLVDAEDLVDTLNSKKGDTRKILSFYDKPLPEKFENLLFENGIANEGPGIVIDELGRLLYMRLINHKSETEQHLCSVLKRLEIQLIKV